MMTLQDLYKAQLQAVLCFLLAVFVAPPVIAQEDGGFFAEDFARSPLEKEPEVQRRVAPTPEIAEEAGKGETTRDGSGAKNERAEEGNLFEERKEGIVEVPDDTLAEARGEPIKKILLVSSFSPREHFDKNIAHLHSILTKHSSLELAGIYAIGTPPRDENGEAEVTLMTLEEPLQFDPQEKGITDDIAQQKIEAEVAKMITASPRFVRGMQISHSVTFMPGAPKNLPVTRSPSWVLEGPDGSQTLLDGIENLSSLINSKSELINTELLKPRDIPAKLLRSEQRLSDVSSGGREGQS